MKGRGTDPELSWAVQIQIGMEAAGLRISADPLTQASHFLECGKAPRPGTWPWEAQVMVPGSTPCYGALVSDRWILAPASCFLE